MSTIPVHFHKTRVYKNTNVFLLLIPPLIFVIVIAAYIVSRATINSQTALETTPSVLGDDKN